MTTTDETTPPACGCGDSCTCGDTCTCPAGCSCGHATGSGAQEA